MEPITIPLAIAGVTQFFKLGIETVFGFKVKGFYTLLVAILAAAALTFVNLEHEVVQNIYYAAVIVGGFTGLGEIGQLKEKILKK